jgi:hypothetical protein
MRWSWVLTALCGAASLSAENVALPPETVALARIRAHMASILARQPNYTCTQEVERSNRRAPRHRYELRDMLRIDVALVNGKELYAWHGASKFEDTELTDMAPPGGAIGTGNFAGHARSVFGSYAPVFTYAGVVPYDRGNAYRYTFVVPQAASGWKVKVNGDEAIVGYHGSFLADVKTLDLIQLEVVADDIPARLQLKSAADVMEYGRLRIGDGDFLLPIASELFMLDRNGNESRNRVKFTGCRQFSGESVLTFAGPDATPEQPMAASDPPAKTEIAIPPDVEFDVSLDTAVDSAASMVGDPVTATLRQNIKHNRRLLFRKGAKLAGRILRLERHGDHCDVDIRFSELESDQARASLDAHLAPEPLAGYQPLFRSLVQTSGEKNRSFLRLRGSDVRLPRGYRLRLRTGPSSVRPAPVNSRRQP